MTSTTSFKTSLKHGSAVFLWTLRNNIAVIVVYLSLIAFSAITNAVFGFATSGVTQDGIVTISNSFSVYSMVSGTFQYALIIGLVICIRSFSYLHNKRQTDMVGSLPVSRRTMYFSRLISSFIISAVPMILVNLFIAIFVTNKIEFGEGEITGININLFDYTFKSALVLFSCICLFGLLSICCGKTADKIISFFAINYGAPIAILLLMVLPALLIMGYHIDINFYWVLIFSPLLSIFQFDTIYWLIFCAATLAGSVFLIKKRKAECAQSHFAYKFPLVAVKLLISFATGIVTALLMTIIAVITDSENGDTALFWVGMILGSAIAYIIIQLIFARGFKGFLKGLIPYGAMILCFAIYFTSLSFGFFGYESYVPNIDDVKSVSFNSGDTAYVGGVNILQHEVTDKNIIKEAIDAHKQVIKLRPEFDKSHMLERSAVSIAGSMGNNYSDVFDQFNDSEITKYNIVYTLKDGRKISRVYTTFNYVDSDDNKYIHFLHTNEYKENVSPIFICDTKYLTSVDLYGVEYESDDDDDSYIVYKNKALSVYKTVMEEYKKYGFDSNDFSEYSLCFNYGESDANAPVIANFAIPKTYKKTIKLINDYMK